MHTHRHTPEACVDLCLQLGHCRQPYYGRFHSYAWITLCCPHMPLKKKKKGFHYLRCSELQLTPKREITQRNPHPHPRAVQCAPLTWIQFRKARRWQICCGTTGRDHCKPRTTRGRCERLRCANRCVLVEETRWIHGIWNGMKASGCQVPDSGCALDPEPTTGWTETLRARGCHGQASGLTSVEIISGTNNLVRMYQWRMWLRLTLSKRAGWSPRRCHASCPAAKRATLAAHSPAPPHRGGELIPGALFGLPRQVCVWWPAGGSMRWAAPHHLPGQLAAGHAAAHHLQQPHRGAAAAGAQLPLRSGVPGLQQQLPDGDIRVHVWESAEAGLPGPLLQHLEPDRGQDVRPLGEPGDAEDDGQPGALRDSPGRVCRKRGPPGAGCESEQPDGP